MKKRILSLILCLVMVLSLLPIQAVADEGSECAHCSHYHYGDYVCEDCRLCSDECSNSDCWYETHCKNCGGCYMKADNWCDECGWCQDCMDNEAHCKDCGRCFVGESKDDLCENCGLCSYHFDRGICSDCNLCDDCAGDEHCPYCPDDPNHLDGDEPCGACYDCARDLGFDCEVCGACFEDGAERCPVHPDGNHCDDTSCAGFVCEECGRCEREDGIEQCNTCTENRCTDCCEEKSIDAGCYTGELCADDPDFDDHFCPVCNQCYHEFAKCADCDHCENCCFDDDVTCAEGCTCDSKEPPTQAPHTHKFKPGVYEDRNQYDHAQKCLICKEIVVEAHKFTGAGKCEKCGWDNTQTLFFVTQPKNATKMVSLEGVPETDPSHPKKNTVTFSVTAVNQAGNPLNYQWYVVVTSKKNGKVLADYQLPDGGNADHVVISGAKTNKLTVSVPIEACLCSYEYYCQVISQDAEGYQKEIKSEHAALRTQHNYYSGLQIFDSNSNRYVSVVLDDGTVKGLYGQGSKYHNYTCDGASCGHNKLPEGTRHTFVFEEVLGRGSYMGQSAKYYFYVWKCSECGYKELRASSTKLDSTTFDYSITIVNTKGAYIQDSDDITRTTARQGEKMYATAPAKDAFGNAFKEWKVVDGPDGFTVSQYVDGGGVVPGCFYFIMPTGNIKLEAVYYTASETATAIKIVEGYGFGYRDIDGSLTMEVTDENKLYVKLTPDSLAPKMIVWDVLYYDGSTPQLIFMDESVSATSETKTTSKPVDSDDGVKIEAKAPGVVRLRATVQDSGGKVSDTITVKILPSPDMEETGHDKHNIVGGGTKVQPTCTKSGYTLHKCEFPGCEYQYRNDFVNPLGHEDTDGDGFCDRCQIKMTGTASGNMSMVGLTKINKVEVNVTAPVCGFTPATAATPTGDDKDLYSAPAIAWDPYVNETETFAGNESYTVLIKLEAKDGYGFKLNGIIDSNNTQFYINGNKATVVYRDAQEASISYTFPATESVHVHNYQWKSDADKHWRECFCGDKIDTAAHTPSDWITDTAATAITAGTKHKECTTCGYVTETGTIPATGMGHTHSFDGAWKSNADKHWKECSCGVKSDSAAHTPSDWIIDTAATATTDGTKHKACTTCGYVTETGTIPATGAGHTHSFDSAWKFDAANHWKECSCGTKSETAAHTESARIIDTAAGFGTTGAWHTECETCGMQMNSGTIDALKKIDTAEITVTAPVRRGKPEAAATKDSAEARYHVANTDWDPVVTNRFASGTKYTVKVTLEANDGYGFQLNGLLGIGNTDFFINGKKATVVSGDAQQVIITYQFPATGRASSGGSSGGTTTAQPVKSPGTGDAGIALYAAMGLLSLSGGAWVVGKKRKGK